MKFGSLLIGLVLFSPLLWPSIRSAGLGSHGSMSLDPADFYNKVMKGKTNKYKFMEPQQQPTVGSEDDDCSPTSNGVSAFTFINFALATVLLTSNVISISNNNNNNNNNNNLNNNNNINANANSNNNNAMNTNTIMIKKRSAAPVHYVNLTDVELEGWTLVTV